VSAATTSPQLPTFAVMQQQPGWLKDALSNLNIKALNEMQEAALEATSKHKDLILLSATGSGKTLAFLLPLVQQLRQSPTETKAIIIVPSRELADTKEKLRKTI
jgi:superfamily II DNA/RNA helicase